MGLLDSVLGSALGGALGGGQAGGQAGGSGGMQGALLQAVIGMLAQNGQGGAGGGLGGLSGLIDQFQRSGLGEVAASWVSTGQNLPVSAEQLQNVLPGDMVSGLAQQLGMGHSDVLGQLSQLLPQLVDKATPQGQLPQGGGLGDLGQLGGLLSGLLGR